MRASRLLSMLILLQLRGRVTAAAFAAEFEVSQRTVYRDVDALSAAGVPVYADRGPGGGFALLDGWRTRLTGLTPPEVEAMVVAGLPEAARALGLSGATGAGQKLRAALPGDAAAHAERVAGRVHVDLVDWYRARDDVPHLPLLLRAVLDERRVAMRYDSWTGVRDWTVDPLGLVAKGGHWYLVAVARGTPLSFRVSNISAVEMLDEPAERQRGFDLARWWAAQTARFEAELRPMTVRLRVLPAARLRVRDLGAYAAAALNAARGDEIDLPVENLDQAAQLVLGLAPDVVALDANVRAKVADLAATAIALHG
jgi:predicted DNA-binding transcriptional regulator YafY